MIADGIFIHHLVDELKQELINSRINKIMQIDNNSFLFNLQGRRKLYISLNPDICHLRLTNSDYIASSKHFPVYTALKRNFESSVIKDITQYENDRIVVIEVEASDELGFKSTYFLILEFFGRNSNLFVVDSEFIIVDCLKKSFVLEDNDKRILVPKMKYTFPEQTKTNPFKTNEVIDINNYQGMSNLVYAEVIYRNTLDFIKQKPIPTLIKTAKKTLFSCFDLTHIEGEKLVFPTLSELLEEYYINQKNITTQNNEQKLLENYLKREIAKIKKKIQKQIQEKDKAYKNLSLEKIGNLLSANLHKVEKHASSITVEDFYNNNELIKIELDPKLSPAQNLEAIFNRYKKAKRAIGLISEQIEASKNELEYLETLQNQLSIAKHQEIKEILDELGLMSSKEKARHKRKPQIELETFEDRHGNIIWVGKNNIQNNYLTHQLAKKTDYFFHVKDIPGSHTILRTNNLTDEVIRLSAQIAAYYSKARQSSNVAVDYTLVKYIKKVPKTKGSFVTYTNQKTVFVTPDIDYIKDNTI